MTSNQRYPLLTGILLAMICAVLSLRCDESLPVHVVPANVLSIQITKAEQLPDELAIPGKQMVHLQLTGENTYDDVFQDTVDIIGTMTIWWQGTPQLSKTIPLSVEDLNQRNLISGKLLTLLPGQKFSMDIYWDCRSDGGIYLPARMNYTYLYQRLCSPNVACSDPVQFVIETSLKMFVHLDYVSAPDTTFTFVGRICYLCGIPPCPPPPGGCDN